MSESKLSDLRVFWRYVVDACDGVPRVVREMSVWDMGEPYKPRRVRWQPDVLHSEVWHFDGKVHRRDTWKNHGGPDGRGICFQGGRYLRVWEGTPENSVGEANLTMSQVIKEWYDGFDTDNIEAATKAYERWRSTPVPMISGIVLAECLEANELEDFILPGLRESSADISLEAAACFLDILKSLKSLDGLEGLKNLESDDGRAPSPIERCLMERLPGKTKPKAVAFPQFAEKIMASSSTGAKAFESRHNAKSTRATHRATTRFCTILRSLDRRASRSYVYPKT